jgi:hypothetical protein
MSSFSLSAGYLSKNTAAHNAVSNDSRKDIFMKIYNLTEAQPDSAPHNLTARSFSPTTQKTSKKRSHHLSNEIRLDTAWATSAHKGKMKA